MDCLGQSPKHDADHGETDEGHGGASVAFEITSEPAVARNPGEGSLDDPSLGQNDEVMRLGALDDFDLPSADVGYNFGDAWSLVTGIRKELDDRRETAFGVAQQTADAIAVLQVSAMDDDVQQQAEGVDDDVPLAAGDLLARVIALRVDRSPPFCAALALWLSRIATVGSALRPAAVRTWTYRA